MMLFRGKIIKVEKDTPDWRYLDYCRSKANQYAREQKGNLSRLYTRQFKHYYKTVVLNHAI